MVDVAEEVVVEGTDVVVSKRVVVVDVVVNGFDKRKDKNIRAATSRIATTNAKTNLPFITSP